MLTFVSASPAPIRFVQRFPVHVNLRFPGASLLLFLGLSSAAVDVALDAAAGAAYSIGSGYRGNGTFYTNDPSSRVRATSRSGVTSYLPGGGTHFFAPTSIAYASFLNVPTVYVAATALVGSLPSLFTIDLPNQVVSLITSLPEPARWMDVTSDGRTVYFVGVNGSKLYAVDMPIPSPSPTPSASPSASTSPSATPSSSASASPTASSTPSSTPTATPCPAGYMCTGGGSGSVRLCPGGFYCDRSTLFLCPGGYFCPNGTAAVGPSLVCPRGYVCPVGTEHPISAPPGQFALAGATGSRALAAITAPGYFCPGSCYSPFGEPTGGKCPKGTYCPPASTAPLPCDVGTYSNETGRTTPCDPCPVGTFNPDAGGAALSSCRRCSAGLTTLRTGTTGRGGCISIGYSCPAGMMPRAGVAKPHSDADCEPVVCPRGFVPSADHTSCEGE